MATHPLKEQYIACSDMDLRFDEEEIVYTVNWWQSGRNMMFVAEKLNRDPDEILLLCIDLLRKGMILARQGSFRGKR